MQDNLENLNSALNSDDILEKYGITEYTASDIIKDFDDAMAFKVEQARIFKILDAADQSNIWKVYNRRIPNFVQTPVNNPITVIKEATKASIMPTSYAGDFRALSLASKQLAHKANRFFQMKWEQADLDMFNNQAADYAFLHGTSGVLFGWNKDIVEANDSHLNLGLQQKSPLQVKVYHPSNIFPDPSAELVDEMRYLFFSERKTKAFLRSIPRFKDSEALIENAVDSLGQTNYNYIPDKDKQFTNDVVTFLTCYKKVFREKINPKTGYLEMMPSIDIIYMAGRTILDISKDIQPNRIPFIPLYDEKVPNNFWGISKCYKVLSLVLTLNQLDSTEATAYFKHQNPPEFVNIMANLNLAEYQNKKDNPDKAFVVNCDPRIVQAYAQRPDLPKNLDTFRQYLIQTIQNISGVDAAYLGASYGSIQTTGGVQEALNRSTMRDSNRIKEIDKFIKDEINLMIEFFIYHGKKEQFFDMPASPTREAQGEMLEFDPIELLGREDIAIVVSNTAPRSNASYEDAALKLMELQMKYLPSEHGYADFITPEELVSWLNIPKAQQNVLMDRMKMQTENLKLEEYTAVLTAIGTLTEGGMPVEQAIQEVAKQIEDSKMAGLPATPMRSK